jgi:hypothetical protein
MYCSYQFFVRVRLYTMHNIYNTTSSGGDDVRSDERATHGFLYRETGCGEVKLTFFLIEIISQLRVAAELPSMDMSLEILI